MSHLTIPAPELAPYEAGLADNSESSDPWKLLNEEVFEKLNYIVMDQVRGHGSDGMPLTALLNLNLGHPDVIVGMLKNWVATGQIMYLDGRFYGTWYYNYA